MDILKTYSGIKFFVDWNALSPAVEKLVMLRPDEFVEGIIIANEGLQVCVSRKRGRKINETAEKDLYEGAE